MKEQQKPVGIIVCMPTRGAVSIETMLPARAPRRLPEQTVHRIP
jgi:hypothetical protein